MVATSNAGGCANATVTKNRIVSRDMHLCYTGRELGLDNPLFRKWRFTTVIGNGVLPA
jgi:hypothetical protein